MPAPDALGDQFRRKKRSIAPYQITSVWPQLGPVGNSGDDGGDDASDQGDYAADAGGDL